MRAVEKVNAFGVQALAEEISRLFGEHHLATVYRWRKALQEGQGIRDANKRKLIKATAGSPHAITWEDFQPGAPA